METCIKSFEELTKEELYQLLQVRESVFVVEQNCPYQEIDSLDTEAVHIFFRESGRILAYCRIYKKDESTMQIGRVLSTRRRQGYGLQLLKCALAEIRKDPAVTSIIMEAQLYAIPFYEKAGFTAVGEPFDEDGIMHILMRLTL